MLRFLNLAPLKGSKPVIVGHSRLVKQVKHGSHFAGPEGGRHKLLELAKQFGDFHVWEALGRHLQGLGEEISSAVLLHFVEACPVPYLRWWAIEELQDRSDVQTDAHAGSKPAFIVVSERHDSLMGTAHARTHQEAAKTAAYARTEAQREKRRSKGH